jgi:ATP-dependent RNA helicase RhlE
VPFQSFNLDPNLLKGIKELGFVRPTPIQSEAIPPGLAGKDILACAMTGSGKTAAFLLPILHQLIGRPRGTTRALVLTPTRELAAQILEDLDDLAVHTPITAAAIFGGVGMGPQEHAIRSGVDVLIATPGRFIDHLRASYANMNGLKHLVLDEADRMLDMGFLPEIRKILARIPDKRQTLFFSATMPSEIAGLAKEMLRHPVLINLERQTKPPVGIKQAIYPVPQVLKSSLLTALLQQGEIEDALVFTRTKHRADRLTRFLERQGIRVNRIHGNRSQGQRTEALSGFKAGKYQVLVATDIASRGIDVEELGHVVNFDVPRAPEDYVHRVGRTGRAEATGVAFTFVSPEEEAELAKIERVVGKKLPRVTMPGFDYAARPAPERRTDWGSKDERGEPSRTARRSQPAGGRGQTQRGAPPPRRGSSEPTRRGLSEHARRGPSEHPRRGSSDHARRAATQPTRGGTPEPTGSEKRPIGGRTHRRKFQRVTTDRPWRG